MDPVVPLTTEQGEAILTALDEWLETPGTRDRNRALWVTARMAADRLRVVLRTYV